MSPFDFILKPIIGFTEPEQIPWFRAMSAGALSFDKLYTILNISLGYFFRKIYHLAVVHFKYDDDYVLHHKSERKLDCKIV